MAFKFKAATFSFTETTRAKSPELKGEYKVSVQFFTEDGKQLIEVIDGDQVTVVENPLERSGATMYKPRMTDSKYVVERVRAGSLKSVNPFTGEEKARPALKVVRGK